MCPACLTTIALIAAMTASTGGMAALVVTRRHAAELRKNNFPHPGSKEASS
jgi:hypothetical protein